jgi:hypothetical protein
MPCTSERAVQEEVPEVLGRGRFSVGIWVALTPGTPPFMLWLVAQIHSIIKSEDEQLLLEVLHDR